MRTNVVKMLHIKNKEYIFETNLKQNNYDSRK